ncbi:hypothetical protein PMI16_03225 [Herbaspirillum sp. CF444]|uniref:hypothetical protein n=1 Tax=Herbaspirillum sp. CF444 TaxID=1144319 RepID=UPI0002725DD7|nr:hypothetical protein [Herbaspirillum sp. CF444]EJL86483.1 hypothetical protein PMI16_03225 [Herbaspirillum sp. CF444]
MLQSLSGIPIRKECPPGACVCDRESLLDRADPDTDLRILTLTQEQERRLIERIDRIDSYDDLQHVSALLYKQLGVVLRITPSPREVRTVRGFVILLEDQPGLCKKTRQAVPAAIRKCLENHPEIAFTILNAHDLLGDA